MFVGRGSVGVGARRLAPFVRQATDVRETFERRQCPVSTTSESTSTFAPSTIPATSLEEKPPFRPKVVTDLSSAGLNFAQIEGLVLKFLLNIGVASGRRIADELGLPFGPFPDFLRQLKNQQIVAYTNSATANDYLYALTDAGRRRAKVYFEECAYVGTAPVPVRATTSRPSPAQTITAEQPKMADLRRAFSDLLISEEMFQTLGPAINSGRGMFLYGYPGNGKTSIAERITRCFGSTVWIPRVIDVEGQIIKLFDLANHEPVEPRRGGPAPRPTTTTTAGSRSSGRRSSPAAS